MNWRVILQSKQSHVAKFSYRLHTRAIYRRTVCSAVLSFDNLPLSCKAYAARLTLL